MAAVGKVTVSLRRSTGRSDAELKFEFGHALGIKQVLRDGEIEKLKKFYLKGKDPHPNSI
jgi:hypothetical protein